MTTWLEVAGWLQIALAAMHAGFPRYFGWRQDLSALQPINRQMMWVHFFFVALTVGGFGLLSVSSAELLAGTPLGHRVCAGLAGFWGLRLATQFGGYSSDLWRGRTFETAVHVTFVALWTFLTLVYGAVALPGR